MLIVFNDNIYYNTNDENHSNNNNMMIINVIHIAYSVVIAKYCPQFKCVMFLMIQKCLDMPLKWVMIILLNIGF